MSTENDHGHSRDEILRRLADARSRSHLKDTIFGAVDGTVTTFAIISAVAGAGLSYGIIVALGVANVLADGLSMAAGNYTATKAEADDIERLRAIEERHIRDYPDGERAELEEILAQKGLSGEVLKAATEAIASNRDNWVRIMLTDEYGVAPTDPHPIRAALWTLLAFVGAGLIPLLPFILSLPGAFGISASMTALVFFGIGALKSRWSLASWWRSGLETLLIGAAAASVAYFVGSLFDV